MLLATLSAAGTASGCVGQAQTPRSPAFSGINRPASHSWRVSFRERDFVQTNGRQSQGSFVALGYTVAARGSIRALRTIRSRRADGSGPLEMTYYRFGTPGIAHVDFSDCSRTQSTDLPSTPTVRGVLSDSIGPLRPEVDPSWHRTKPGIYQRSDGVVTTIISDGAGRLGDRTVTIRRVSPGAPIIAILDHIALFRAPLPEARACRATAFRP